MVLYAFSPARRTAQVLGDVLFVCWLAAWILVGGVVHEATMGLAEPGRSTTSVGTELAQNFRDAGTAVEGLPVVGERVRAPFDRAAGSADRLAGAGRQMVGAAERLADWLRLAVTLVPILVVGVFYLPGRVRFVRRATSARRYIDASADLDLFALRALARQPMHVLARVSPDPAGAWRRGDREITRRLAEIELRSTGLRLPSLETGAG